MNKDAPAEAPTNNFQKRIENLEKVTLETPALLNMIKHCQDKTEITGQQAHTSDQSELGGARGMVMGVLKKDLEIQSLLVTQTMPDFNKGFRNLKQILDQEKDKQNDINNEIGFYVSCQLGMAFSHKNLLSMISSYRNFRNSVMIVYDVTKSTYGLNPLKCYRLSQAAIDCLNLNNPGEMTDSLLQDRIRDNSLESLFAEIPIKIHRSHLL